MQTESSVLSVRKRNDPVGRAVVWDMRSGFSVPCKLSLWPRPHHLRSSSLDSSPPQVRLPWQWLSTCHQYLLSALCTQSPSLMTKVARGDEGHLVPGISSLMIRKRASFFPVASYCVMKASGRARRNATLGSLQEAHQSRGWWVTRPDGLGSE